MSKNMVVLGDSIQWGQGLSGQHKMSHLLAETWRARTGEEVLVHTYAHSGADVWDDGQSGILAAINPVPPVFAALLPRGDGAILRTRACEKTQAGRDGIGEVPDEEPYLLRQILDAGKSVGADADLVLLDAGINDTEVYNLVLPGKSAAAVRRRALSLLPRVRLALSKVRTLFPNARLLLTGYYPIVSLQTDLFELLQFVSRVVRAAHEESVDWADNLLELKAPQLDFAPFGAPLALGAFAEIAALDAKSFPARLNPLRPVLSSIAERNQDWANAVNGVLQQASDELGQSGASSAFVEPGFLPEHAIFAPASLLWAYEHGEPTDPLAGARKKYCVDNGVVGFDRLLVECASLGHPNVAGARRYADKLTAAAEALGLFELEGSSRASPA